MANESPFNNIINEIRDEIKNRKKTPSERIMMLSMERD